MVRLGSMKSFIYASNLGFPRRGAYYNFLNTRTFRYIVGFIVILFDVLSISSLAKLLSISKGKVTALLRFLHVIRDDYSCTKDELCKTKAWSADTFWKPENMLIVSSCGSFFGGKKSTYGFCRLDICTTQ